MWYVHLNECHEPICPVYEKRLINIIAILVSPHLLSHIVSHIISENHFKSQKCILVPISEVILQAHFCFKGSSQPSYGKPQFHLCILYVKIVKEWVSLEVIRGQWNISLFLQSPKRKLTMVESFFLFEERELQTNTVLDSWILFWITSHFKDIKIHNQLRII